MNGKTVMDPVAYQAKVKTMSAEALRFVMRDACEALAAYADSPNTDYYQDEICHCGQELQRRRERGFGDRQAWVDAIMTLVDRMVMDLTPDATTLAEARVHLHEALGNETVRGMIRRVAGQTVTA
jgi:hypothetical protein